MIGFWCIHLYATSVLADSPVGKICSLQPRVHCPFHGHAVAIDFYETLGQHAYCPDKPAAHFRKNAQNVSGFVAVFFLQSRSAVLDCGHTSGQHAQCLVTPTTHFEISTFFWAHGGWPPSKVLEWTGVWRHTPSNTYVSNPTNAWLFCLTKKKAVWQKSA